MHQVRELRDAMSDRGDHDGEVLVRGDVAMTEDKKSGAEGAGVVGRRGFFSRAATVTTVSTMAFAGIGIARMPKPGVASGRTEPSPCHGERYGRDDSQARGEFDDTQITRRTWVPRCVPSIVQSSRAEPSATCSLSVGMW